MPTAKLTPDEVVDRGEAIYRERLQAHLEPGNIGKFLVIDINTGDYEMGPEYLPLTDAMIEANPSAVLYILKIGYPAAVSMGGRLKPNAS